MKKVATVILALATLAIFTANAAAQEPVEYKVTVKGEVVKGSLNDHFVTFSAPVQLPEVSLPAGTYIFSLVAPSVVQVTNVDRSQHYALVFTAPVHRPDATDEFEMTFVSADATAPRRLDKWFLPNQSLGFEFLYPQGEVRGAR